MEALIGPVMTGHIPERPIGMSDILANIVLIGNTEVGKTSIFHSFQFGESGQHPPTHLVDCYYANRKVSDNDVERNISLKIFDTAGQERYRALGQAYYRDAQAALAVFDITDQKTLDDLKGWIETYKMHAPQNAHVIIAGNKIDKMPREEQDFIRIRAQMFADDIQAELFFTSALTGEGIADVFSAIFRVIATSSIELVTEGMALLKSDESGHCNC